MSLLCSGLGRERPDKLQLLIENSVGKEAAERHVMVREIEMLNEL